MNQNTNDILLIEEFKNTENASTLNKLYEPYMPLVFGTCLKYLKNREDAKDAVIDIYEKLMKELVKHDAPEVFRTWLYVVTKNFCLMKIRQTTWQSEQLKINEPLFMDNEYFLHPLDTDNEDLSEILKKCIEELKTQQKKCIIQFYYSKKCYREIADKLNITEKKVKSDLQNGKRNLKLCIENNREE